MKPKKTKITRKKNPKPATLALNPLLKFREYQATIFNEQQAGILVLHWSRQIGKSYILAAWAVDRLLTRPGRLVTVLSNSKNNGGEFVVKVNEVCQLLAVVLRKRNAVVETEDLSTDPSYENMRMEVRITLPDRSAEYKTGRIIVLAANPRTARGFSGDLILDEFAFHEDSNAIWEAAEPILSSNADFQCRIASTGNGKHNMFYRMVSGGNGSSEFRVPGSELANQPDVTPVPGKDSRAATSPSPSGASGDGSEQASGVLDPTRSARADAGGDVAARHPYQPTSIPPNPIGNIFPSAAGFLVSRVTRTAAHAMGVLVYDPNTRAAINPAHARARALDKGAYDQNYECAFADENMTLLTHELISAAERDGIGFICEQDWTAEVLEYLRNAHGDLCVGIDVARKNDFTVMTVVEKLGELRIVRALLRIRDMRLPDQQLRLGELCRLPRFRRAAIDMTGLGLGLYEYSAREFGAGRIQGVDFSTSVPVTNAIQSEGRAGLRVKTPEALAMELLQAYETRRIQHPADAQLRDDLRKPEKMTTPGGRVSIAATRTSAGHADHFWSFALALEAASGSKYEFAYASVSIPGRPYPRIGRRKGILI